MGRWEPNAPGRLLQAALELYGERGFEQTTVAEIAERAGLTERTFFRHYADKREVLFAGGAELERTLLGAVQAAPENAAPIEVVAGGIAAISESLGARREFARARHEIVAASPELRERELIKLASLAQALTAALRERGVAEPAASLTAEAGIAVFKIAFERWVNDDSQRDLPEFARDSFEQLTAVTAAAS